MRINLAPQRRDDTITASVFGDVLVVNGEAFDFSPLADGDELPYGSITGENAHWFAGPVNRVGGQLELTLLLPNGPNPSQAVAFPDPLTVVNGPVPFPFDPIIDPEAIPPDFDEGAAE